MISRARLRFIEGAAGTPAPLLRSRAVHSDFGNKKTQELVQPVRFAISGNVPALVSVEHHQLQVICDENRQLHSPRSRTTMMAPFPVPWEFRQRKTEPGHPFHRENPQPNSVKLLLITSDNGSSQTTAPIRFSANGERSATRLLLVGTPPPLGLCTTDRTPV